jgi:hypothetical protein
VKKGGSGRNVELGSERKDRSMNEKRQSEEYYAELAEHRTGSDANESNAMGTIYPAGEPVEATGRFSEVGDANEDERSEE